MNTSFQAVCEAAAIEWSVPAIAAGTIVGGRERVVAVGCDAGARFRVASVTKPFTALLALSLLDAEEQTGIWPPDVRVRHLLSHTSGYDCELAERDLARFGDGDGALASVVAELPAVRRYVGVEQVWSYANTGYWLAGHLAAEHAGTTYEEALAERVLGPFGLEATGFGEPDLATCDPEADEGPYPRARRPSGGLVSTVADLLRFGRRLLAEPLGARLRIVHGKPVGGVYGLGLFGERVGGAEVWGHPGSYGGFESSLLVVPEREAVFVGLTNSPRGGKALYDVENAFFEEAIGARRREADFVEAPVEAFTGSYANSDGWYEVAAAGDGALVTWDDQEYRARAIGERTFQVVEGDKLRSRFDFPLEGFGRFGSRLAERIA